MHLKFNIDAVHEGKKRFKCSFCNEDFSKKVDKKIHISTVHKEKKSTSSAISVISENETMKNKRKQKIVQRSVFDRENMV